MKDEADKSFILRLYPSSFNQGFTMPDQPTAEEFLHQSQSCMAWAAMT
jgi:hypothetical protein